MTCSAKKSVSAILFLFVFLSALLASAGTGMIVALTSSMNGLLAKSAVPHYVQMHSGTLNEAEIDRWAARNELVEMHQVVEMVPVEGGHLVFGGRDTPENTSIMDFYFVRQNERFDFLLNLENDIIDVAEGEIAVPVYFMQQRELAVGGRVRIVHPNFEREFIIRDFVRDAQMNPSIIHSKRFVIHPADYELLKQHANGVEYLIEFRLADPGKLGQFNTLYQSSAMPKTGPSIDLNLFRMLNALSDGVIAAVTLLVSLLLMLIALLCVRFTLLATLEEDYREIGVLKAIGASRRAIRSIYLVKYAALAAAASLCGCAASYPAARLLSANMALYLGKGERGPLAAVLPLAAAVLLFGLLLLFCLLVLRRFPPRIDRGSTPFRQHRERANQPEPLAAAPQPGAACPGSSRPDARIPAIPDVRFADLRLHRKHFCSAAADSFSPYDPVARLHFLSGHRQERSAHRPAIFGPDERALPADGRGDRPGWRRRAVFSAGDEPVPNAGG